MLNRFLCVATLVPWLLGAASASAGPRYFGYYGSSYIGSSQEPPLTGCEDADFNGHTNVSMVASSA